MTSRLIACVCAALVAAVSPAFAQSPPATGRLLVTVADQTGAVIPNARVTAVRQDETTQTVAVEPVLTSPLGLAAIEGLAPGRYTVTAAFAGFETVTLRDFRVRAGDNRRTVTLPIKKVAEDVTVERDKQSSAVDPRGNAFSTVLTREQIEALPDDPDEMEAALKAMSPPGAVLRVDGFTGGKLPPKSQIRSIRLPRMDMMAAQNHGGGMMGMLHIDVMTQPGAGPLRGSVDVALRDDALNARNPFTPVKGDEGLRQGAFSLSGTIKPNKSSFSVSVQQARLFDSGNLLAAVPGQTLADSVRRPTDRLVTNARFDQALGPAHMLRASYQSTVAEMRNQGVGSFDLPERAFTTNTSDHIVRLSENGPVGRRLFSESRFQLRWSRNDAASSVEAPAMRVLDAFTSGGAQRQGGLRAFDVEIASDLDYVRGSHSMRTGFLLEGGRYRSTDFSNYLGTYTFASLADYEAGRPSNYTRRIGSPDFTYSNYQLGLYVQDDFRAHKSLMLSYGLRYEAQSLIADQNNFSPRLSATWSPLKSGRTTLRGGAGWFADWLGTSTYEQTLRVDGFRQREINVLNPSFPEDGEEGISNASNRYLLGSTLALPLAFAANAGVDQTITPVLRLGATYTYRRGGGQLRGRNLNAPVDGVRPDPSFANVIEVVGDAEARTHSFGVNASLIMLNWRQTFFAVNYTYSKSETNTTGAFSLPANGDDLSTEWGLSAPKHRFGGAFNMQPIKNLGVSLQFRGMSGTPYTMTTGTDVNGDGVFNDRPAGVQRASMFADSQWDVGARVSYAIGFGQRPQTGGGGGGPMVIAIGGGMPGGFGGGAADARFRLEFYASAQNVTNHRNYVGYSGVLTSPFFGTPTNVMNPRKVEIGMRFGF